jgi:hypothetical protein
MKKQLAGIAFATAFLFGYMEKPAAAEAEIFTSGHRYRLVTSDCAWSQAFQFVKDTGEHLACFETLDEYTQFLVQIRNSGMTGIRFRIGGRRGAGSQEYHWVDGSGALYGEALNDFSSWVYPYWMYGEPSYMDGETVEDYMDLFYYGEEGRWVLNDVPDDMISIVPEYSGQLGYIIEFENDAGIQPSVQGTDASVALASAPAEFYFSSGVGAWGTTMTLNKDGTFNGSFHDSNMGADTDIYPGGEILLCNFAGQFTDFQKIDDYTWSMRLSSLEYETTPGTDWTDGQIHYIANDAYGISGGALFYLYLPGHPMDTIPEEYKGWARSTALYNNPDVFSLPFYGIYNVDKALGWVSG